MIGLFFEVHTRPGHRDQYLNLAASLKPDLEAMGGCLFIDRFRSLTQENLLLSHQIWHDEGALLFVDPTTEYFRIFEVMRDYGMYERTEAPQYYPPVRREQ